MNYYLYILYSLVYKKHYIGITNNLEKRLNEHNAGKVFSTKPYGPYKLVYKEKYLNKTIARKREIFLKKTAKARTELFASINYK